MKKRTISVVLSMAMIAGAVTVPSVSVAAEAEYKVAMVVGSPISDGGFISGCYQGMVDAAEEMGWETTYTDNVPVSDFATVMSDYADLEYDMIFLPGNEYSDAVAQVSEEYPDTYFCLLNGAIESDNVMSVMPDALQIGYLAGALAGLLTETNNIGFIGGMEIDTTKSKLEGFEAGAKAVNPDVNVSSAYAGSYDDVAKGKEIASSMIATYDVDVMFGDASAVDAGAREALAEHEKKYSIAQPGDFGAADDKVIASSVVTDNPALVKTCMEAVEAGEFGNKTVHGNVADGCLSVGTFSDVIVTPEIKEQYLECVEKIKEGTFIEEK